MSDDQRGAVDLRRLAEAAAARQAADAPAEPRDAVDPLAAQRAEVERQMEAEERERASLSVAERRAQLAHHYREVAATQADQVAQQLEASTRLLRAQRRRRQAPMVAGCLVVGVVLGIGAAHVLSPRATEVSP